MRLERHQINTVIRGIVSGATLTFVCVQWFGLNVLELKN